MMGDRLKGKVAVVTGSGQGIGRAVALQMAAEGAKIITNNRKPGSASSHMLTAERMASMSMGDQEKVNERYAKLKGDAATTAQQIRDAGGEAAPFFGDTANFDAAKELIQFAVKTYGRIDILANIAGDFGFAPVAEITEEMWDRVTGVKPKGYFNTIHFAVPYMVEQSYGRIINCTSRAFLGDRILHAEYCAANAGVVGLTRAVAIELYGKGVTCNAFDPFARTRAAIDLEACANDIRTNERLVLESTLLPTFDMTPTPEQIAPFLTYLATDATAKISGSVFSLAGNTIGIYSEPVVRASMTKYGPDAWTVDEIAQAVPSSILRQYTSIAEPLRLSPDLAD